MTSKQHADNQTTRSSRKLPDTALGTGLLFIREHGKPDRKVLVPAITYKECVCRGQTAMAFKWIPHSRASLEDLLKDNCGTPMEVET